MSEQSLTHYIPYFTSSPWPRAVCGLSSRFVTVEHSAEPTCLECAAWLNASADELKQQDAARQREEQEVGR